MQSTGNALIHLRAENGLALPATTVFARVLEHFKKEAQSNVGRRTGVDWNADEVTWIVTVPAIWGERARGVMKAAAIEVCRLVCACCRCILTCVVQVLCCS